MDREAVERYYRKCCGVRDNLGPHLPILRALAEECDVVVEFGVQRGRSTVAFLLGARQHVYSYDIEEFRGSVRQMRVWAGDKWTFQIADSRRVDIPECDLLFIDTEHTYKQLKAELASAAHLVRRYLVFHDTMLFGMADASGVGEKTVPGTPGLLPAIREYSWRDHPGVWRVKENHKDRYGLMVLERLP